MNYQSIGSGGGIAQITAKTVDFGASDMPLKPADLEKKGLVQFPPVIGGEVMVVNLPGIQAGQMTLDGPTIASIYLGKITKWSDPAIAKLNPDGAALDAGSKVFQAAAANADWKGAPGFHLILTDQPGKESWPITGATFILMHKEQARPERAKEVLKFFDWAYKNGAPLAEAL